jgi:HlyD family secretion protein
MKRLLIFGIPVLFIIIVAGWRLHTKQVQNADLKSAATSGSTGPLSVDYAIAGPRDIKSVVSAVGTIQAQYAVKLSPKIQGLITYLEVREGDPVKAGEVLVRLDPDTITAAIAQDKANVANAKFNYTNALIKQNPANVSVNTTIEQGRAGLQSAQANLNQVTQNYGARLAQAKSTVTDDNAKIDQAKATVESAKANLQSAGASRDNAQTLLNRDLELYKQNYIAAQDVDNAKTALAVAVAAVNVAQKGVDAANQTVKSAVAQREGAQDIYDETVKQANADIQTAKATVATSQATLKYDVSNSAQKPAYVAQLQALQAQINAAEGQLHSAETQLADTNLSSPVDGTVTARTADPGTMSQPGTPVLTVETLKAVYFNASIPVEQSRTIFMGQSAMVTLDALPGKTFTGAVDHVDKSADPTSHQFTVLVKLTNPGLLLRPAMYGHLTIVTSSTHADVTVPREAVTTADDGTSSVVEITAQNTAKKVAVTLGASDSVGYQILSGVAAGDRVVSLVYSNLKDGRPLRPNGVTKQMGSGFSIATPTLPGSSGGSSSAGSNGGPQTTSGSQSAPASTAGGAGSSPPSSSGGYSGQPQGSQ